MIKYCIVFISLLGIAVGNSDASKYHEKPVTECGYNATKPAGSLATNGSMALGPNTECMWRIDVENATEIFIFLRIMDLEEGDNVTLYENEIDTEPLFGPFHGQNDQVVILTGVKTLVVRLHTSSEDNHNFKRSFDAGYHAQGPCVITIDEGTTVTAPVSSKNRTSRECTYIYNVQSANMNSFIFETFNLSPGSSVDVSDCENPGAYTQKEKDLIPEFFSSKKATFAIILNNSEDNFRLTKHNVNAECSGYEKIKSDDAPIVLKTPAPLRIDNSSIVVECRKMIESRESTQKLGIDFGNLDFNTVFDILAVNDGPSMLSTPLLQITQTNINETKVKMVRTNGPYIWIAFKPITFASKFAGNVSVHGQGGHYNGSGHIKMISTTGNDTVFLLEVNNNKNVLLNFTSSDFKPPAMLSIYEEFATTSNPIATLHGSVWYPILSSTSKMMLKATNFQTGQFEADFSGVTPGCMHMSPPTGDNYIVSGNCNSTCVWVIPPTDDKDKNLLLNLQYLSLDKNDEVEILHLDSKKTSLAKITPNISHVPQFFIDSKVGAIVNVIRGACTQEKDDIILVAHTNYLPACSKSFSLDLSEKLQITSPSYPNTYPLLAECEWNIARSNANHKLYLSFDKLQLAPNHCINILEQNTTTNFTFYGNHLPDDFIFQENAIVQFKSVNCNNSVGAQALVSDEGFVLNATAMDCGDVITTKNGQFNTVANKTFCIWKVSVDPKEKNGSLNIITFNVKRTQDNGNYELFIYDGSSVRDIMITNTSSEIWSRTNTVIFMYKLLNTSEPAPVINFSYETKSCSVLCNNGICLHPDWKCNSVNDCGDWSDEKDCQALPPIPVPPEIKKSGVSSVTFGLTVVCFFILGVVLTLVVPRALQYYRNSQYRQFRDLSVGE